MRMMPKIIWNKPQNSPANAMASITAEKLPCDDAQAALTSEAVMTVIGPVGPLI